MPLFQPGANGLHGSKLQYDADHNALQSQITALNKKVGQGNNKVVSIPAPPIIVNPPVQTIGLATETADGLMSAKDKTTLDGLTAAGTQVIFGVPLTGAIDGSNTVFVLPYTPIGTIALYLVGGADAFAIAQYVTGGYTIPAGSNTVTFSTAPLSGIGNGFVAHIVTSI